VDWCTPEHRQEVIKIGKQTGFGEYTISVTDIDPLYGLLDEAHERAHAFLDY
jgi:hypothetical protein